MGDPDIREKNQRIALEVYKGDERVGALAVMSLKNHVAVGDRVRVYGTLLLPQAFETENGRTFRYDKYLEARGIRFLIQYGAIYTTESAPWYSVPALSREWHYFRWSRAISTRAVRLRGRDSDRREVGPELIYTMRLYGAVSCR